MNIWNYTFVVMTMILVFQFAGVPTGADPIFSFFGISFNDNNTLSGFSFQISNFWDYIFNTTTGLLATLLGTGIAVGLLATGRADIAIYAGIASSVLIIFIPTMVFIVVYPITNGYSAWASALLGIIFIPLTGGYLMALFKYIGGGS